MSGYQSIEAVQAALAAAIEAHKLILAADKPLLAEAARLRLPDNNTIFFASNRAVIGLKEFIDEAQEFIALKGPIDE